MLSLAGSSTGTGENKRDKERTFAVRSFWLNDRRIVKAAVIMRGAVVFDRDLLEQGVV